MTDQELIEKARDRLLRRRWYDMVNLTVAYEYYLKKRGYLTAYERRRLEKFIFMTPKAPDVRAPMWEGRHARELAQYYSEPEEKSKKLNIQKK